MENNNKIQEYKLSKELRIKQGRIIQLEKENKALLCSFKGYQIELSKLRKELAFEKSEKERIYKELCKEVRISQNYFNKCLELNGENKKLIKVKQELDKMKVIANKALDDKNILLDKIYPEQKKFTIEEIRHIITEGKEYLALNNFNKIYNTILDDLILEFEKRSTYGE